MWLSVCVAGSMFRACASFAFRCRRLHSSSHLRGSWVGDGLVLVAEHLTSCFLCWHSQVIIVLAWQGLSSLQGYGEWQVSMHWCSHDCLVRPHRCEQCDPRMPLSSHWPGRWHVRLQRWKPHISTLSQVRPQWASSRPHGLFLMVRLPHTHVLSTKNGHIGHGVSAGWQLCFTSGCPQGRGLVQSYRH